MKVATVAMVLATAALLSIAAADNPLLKTIELLTSLKEKVTKEGEYEMKAYAEYEHWCHDIAGDKTLELKTLHAEEEKLQADIGKATACIMDASTNIEALAAAIQTADTQLENATLIRKKESDEFKAAEVELMDSIDTLQRAIAIIQREMAKNPALMQVDTANFQHMVQSIGAVIEAAALSAGDQKKLMALVQSRVGSRTSENDEDGADADLAELGAPDSAAYKSHSKSIVDVLSDLGETAESELKDLRQAETSAAHNYGMLKQSLLDQKAADEKEMKEEKATKSECMENKATAEGDLQLCEENIFDTEKALVAYQDTCMQVATDHEASMETRAEELHAIVEAIKVLKSDTPAAATKTYTFLQVVSVSNLKTSADLAGAEVVNLIRSLAKREHSAALSQLASKITAVLKYGTAGGDDPFEKVKGLISELIARLMKQAAEEATEKEYCDEEMAKAEEKKGDLEGHIAKLSAKIDTHIAASAQLKEDVKQEQAELAEMFKSQTDMDKIRAEEREDYLEDKKDLEEGLAAVRQALTILTNYYRGGDEAMLQSDSQFGAFMQQPPIPEHHVAATGAGNSVIGLLEVVEADFAKQLAKRETEESDEQAAYEKSSQHNKVTAAIAGQEVKYKTQEFVDRDKEVAEFQSDVETDKAELDSVMEFYGKLKDRCIAKPETYEERKRRRDAEVAGLKEALRILDSETAFVQRRAGVHAFRR